MYNHTNFFIENLKSLFNIYNVMALIQDYDKLCFYILTVLMSTMILAFVLTLIFAHYNDYYIGTTNILSIPLLNILDRIIV
jgi:putative effector of murein hydrolase